MKYQMKGLLLSIVFPFIIVVCFSQVRSFSERSLTNLPQEQLAVNYRYKPINFLATGNSESTQQKYSNLYFANVTINSTNKFLRRSRLCVVATTTFVTLYLVTKDKNENLALGSAIAALATSSLGVIYYIKARKAR